MPNKKSRPRQFFVLASTLLAIVFVVVGLIRVPDTAQAAIGINQHLNFQGRFYNSQGAVIPDGTYNIEFKIVQDGDGCNPSSGTFPCGGTTQWTETRTGVNKVTVTNGFFSVELGSVTALPTTIWNQDTLWLSTNLGGTGTPTWDGEMKPLRRLTSSPYALNSQFFGGLATTQVVQLAQGMQTDSSTTSPSIAVNKTGTTASILQLQRGGVDVLTVSNAGAAIFKNQTDSSAAFSIQNAAGTALLTADTSGSVIKVSGTATTFATLTLDNSHLKSTQTTAPTIGTPLNCGTGPTATVTAGSTDSAGTFTISSGTLIPSSCDTVITFNKTYGAAPKSIIITPKDVNAAARLVYVSASSATTFTVKFQSNAGASTAHAFYYWVVE